MATLLSDSVKPCLIGMVTYNRLEMTKQCLDSLFDTANPKLYDLMIVDNGSHDGTVEYLKSLNHPCLRDVIFNKENLGTARALNVVWEIAYNSGQHAGKLDNDVTFYDRGWLGKMFRVIEQGEDAGVVGLKRRDVSEKPNTHEPFYRTQLFTLPDGQVVEVANHIIGTCWLVNHVLLKKLGALVQLGPYGLDDAIYCFRAHQAGFVTVFEPSIAIEHVDPGHSMFPVYTQWKIDQAEKDVGSGAYQTLLEEYRSGARPLFQPFRDVTVLEGTGSGRASYAGIIKP